MCGNVANNNVTTHKPKAAIAIILNPFHKPVPASLDKNAKTAPANAIMAPIATTINNNEPSVSPSVTFFALALHEINVR